MTSSENNYMLKKCAAGASLFVSIMLIVLKFVAFIKTDSLAVFSSLIDSVTDLFASFISGVAVYFSMKPANCKHRYGYGKSEALSALLQAIFVGASGVFVIFDGINTQTFARHADISTTMIYAHNLDDIQTKTACSNAVAAAIF